MKVYSIEVHHRLYTELKNSAFVQNYDAKLILKKAPKFSVTDTHWVDLVASWLLGWKTWVIADLHDKILW